MKISEKAKMFAFAAHKAVGQKRKYSGECYTVHLEQVANIVELHGGNDAMIAAAWLHDVVEDTDVTLTEIEIWFGSYVALLVGWVTDISKPEDGNQKARKALDRDHLAEAPAEAQTIKLADLVSNASSIRDNDPKFAPVYLREKSELLAVMNKGNSELFQTASVCIRES